MKTISRKLMTPGSIRTPTGMKDCAMLNAKSTMHNAQCRMKPPVHEVRAVATKTGYKYYFDAQGGSYAWIKGWLKKQKPRIFTNKQTLSHNPQGGYLILSIKSGPNRGVSNRGNIYVHRGVAMAFPETCGVPDLIRNQVDHINGNKYDNRANNLQWLSASENTRKSKSGRTAGVQGRQE